MTNDNYPYGYILSPDGSITPMPKPANDNGTFSLVQLQEAVEGYIELINAAWFPWASLMWPFGITDVDTSEPPQFIFIVNEEGLIDGLPLNTSAPRLADNTIISGNLVVIPEELMQ